MKNKDISIAVIGLGYVGLPLANGLSKKFNTMGYDLDDKKINDLKKGFDNTNELKKINKSLKLTYNLNDIKNCNCYIFCLPTPVDNKKKPDLRVLSNSLKSISKIFRSNIFDISFIWLKPQNVYCKIIKLMLVSY